MLIPRCFTHIRSQNCISRVNIILKCSSIFSLIRIIPILAPSYTVKKIQRILQCFTNKLLQRTTVSAIYSELLLFFTFIFVKYCVFYSVKCKMLRYIVKNIVKYRDSFNRQIRESILPTKYCKFCIFYSKPVIFLQENCIFLHKNCKTNKIQLFCKNIYNILFI